MKLLKALKIGAFLPVIIIGGWFFSSFFLLTASAFLVWKGPIIQKYYTRERSDRSIIFPKENFLVLAASDQQLNDERIMILEQFLKEKNSPLASQAASLIQAADTYKFDWRLLPAIAGKESSFGKRMPWDKQNGQFSHNAWGWGVYGDKAPTFPDWGEAIATVAAGLRHEYYNKGYIDPEIIMKKFTPRSNGSWARDVKTIMEQIAPQEQNESKDQSLSVLPF